MDIGIKNALVAIVTSNRSVISEYCSIPIFYVSTEEEKQTIASNLSKITMSMAHDLGNGCLVLVRH